MWAHERKLSYRRAVPTTAQAYGIITCRWWLTVIQSASEPTTNEKKNKEFIYALDHGINRWRIGDILKRT